MPNPEQMKNFERICNEVLENWRNEPKAHCGQCGEEYRASLLTPVCGLQYLLCPCCKHEADDRLLRAIFGREKDA